MPSIILPPPRSSLLSVRSWSPSPTGSHATNCKDDPRESQPFSTRSRQTLAGVCSDSGSGGGYGGSMEWESEQPYRILNSVFGRAFTRVILPTDGRHDVFIKSWTFVLVIIILVLCVNYAVGHGVPDRFWGIVLAASLFTWPIAAMLYMQIRKKFGTTEMSASILFLAFFSIVPLDLLSQQEMGDRFWVWLVICLDMSLAFSLNGQLQHGLVAFGVFYISFFNFAHEWYPWVLQDPITGEGVNPTSCNCDEPPCSNGVRGSLSYTISYSAVFLIDFSITRGFASSLMSESSKMEAAIATAEELADRLSYFDLESAEKILSKGLDGDVQKLPTHLRRAFGRLLANLRVYEPYLPRSCIPVREGLEDPESADESVASCSVLTEISPVREGQQELFAAAPVLAASRCIPGGARSSSGSGRLDDMAHLGFSSFNAPPTRFRLRKTRLSLLLCNFHDTTQWGLTATDVNETFHCALDSASQIADRNRGIVDLFLGDRIFFSFNAARMCVAHAGCAVSAAKAMSRAVTALSRGVNLAITSGKIVCGDLGSDKVRRFTFLGMLPLKLWGYERLGRALALPVVCNEVCAVDAPDHEFRRVPRNVSLTRLSHMDVCTGQSTFRDCEGGCQPVYEVPVPLASSPQSPSQRSEWMYEIENGNGSKWRDYNAAVEVFLESGSLQNALDTVAEPEKQAMIRHTLGPIGDTTPFDLCI